MPSLRDEQRSALAVDQSLSEALTGITAPVGRARSR
jgi:hypothetical protein